MPAISSLPHPVDTERWPHGQVLVVDDEPGMRNFLVKTLAPRCPLVLEAESAEDAARLLRQHHIDLIILDIALPGRNGVAWLKELREQGYSGQVILITAFADLDTAIEALRAGASDFVLKPFRVPQILTSVRRCFENARLTRENYVLRHTLARDVGVEHLPIGDSPAITRLLADVRRAAAAQSNVLLLGESGTGKELIARALHALSPRADGPFVPVHCAAASPERLESELLGHAKGAFVGATQARDGLFYYARGGTLFFDEVAELPPTVQAVLLRALEDLRIQPLGSQQSQSVDVRIIAATARDLADEVEQGRFRADLYYRLQVIELRLPPLREHKQDIPLLVQHFVQRLSPALGVEPLALSANELDYLQQYDWPGNVRELRNLIERSLILGQLNVSALYAMNQRRRTAGAAAAGPTDLQTLEKQHILTVLDSVQGDKTRAAELLGISRRTLERRCAEWAPP